MNYTLQHLSDIPIEDAHGGSGSRQLLVTPEHVSSQFLEAVTKGFIPAGNMFDWHEHVDTDEIFIVTKGSGKFFCDEDVIDFASGDVITVRANTKHKIEATIDVEGFFIRVKTR